MCIIIWLEPPQWLSLTARSGAAGENSTFPMGKMHLFNDWTYTCQIPPWDINKIPCFGTTNSHCSLCMDDHFDFRDAPHESEGSTTKDHRNNSWQNCTPTVHRFWRPHMTCDNYITSTFMKIFMMESTGLNCTNIKIKRKETDWVRECRKVG